MIVQAPFLYDATVRRYRKQLPEVIICQAMTTIEIAEYGLDEVAHVADIPRNEGERDKLKKRPMYYVGGRLYMPKDRSYGHGPMSREEFLAQLTSVTSRYRIQDIAEPNIREVLRSDRKEQEAAAQGRVEDILIDGEPFRPISEPAYRFDVNGDYVFVDHVDTDSLNVSRRSVIRLDRFEAVVAYGGEERGKALNRREVAQISRWKADVFRSDLLKYPDEEWALLEEVDYMLSALKDELAGVSVHFFSAYAALRDHAGRLHREVATVGLPTSEIDTLAKQLQTVIDIAVAEEVNIYRSWGNSAEKVQRWNAWKAELDGFAALATP